jgi:hypothetical protein
VFNSERHHLLCVIGDMLVIDRPSSSTGRRPTAPLHAQAMNRSSPLKARSSALPSFGEVMTVLFQGRGCQGSGVS